MFDKRVVAVGGLPRSGSTLLMNILAQNPQFHATATSGILEILVGVRNQWDQVVAFKAAPNDTARRDVLSSILHGYFHSVPHPVVFDKSRGWLGHIEMLEMIGEHITGKRTKAKLLVPVRDIRDVLASFEKLYRANKGERATPGEKEYPIQFQTVEGRCEVWAGAGGVVGSCYNRLRDAIARGYRDRLHLIEFEKLTAAPRATLQGIYDFLEQPYWEHDFEHVQQVTQEDDTEHGYKSLHDIRPAVRPMEPSWPHVLPKAVADKYGNKETNFWRS